MAKNFQIKNLKSAAQLHFERSQLTFVPYFLTLKRPKYSSLVLTHKHLHTCIDAYRHSLLLILEGIHHLRKVRKTHNSCIFLNSAFLYLCLLQMLKCTLKKKKKSFKFSMFSDFQMFSSCKNKHRLTYRVTAFISQ